MSFGIYCFRLGKRLLSIFHDNSVTFWIKNLKLQPFLSAINTERGYYFRHLHDTIIICEAIYGSWFENFLLFFFFPSGNFPEVSLFIMSFLCVLLLYFLLILYDAIIGIIGNFWNLIIAFYLPIFCLYIFKYMQKTLNFNEFVRLKIRLKKIPELNFHLSDGYSSFGSDVLIIKHIYIYNY